MPSISRWRRDGGLAAIGAKEAPMRLPMVSK
jgi:hypothetical protein